MHHSKIVKGQDYGNRFAFVLWYLSHVASGTEGTRRLSTTRVEDEDAAATSDQAGRIRPVATAALSECGKRKRNNQQSGNGTYSVLVS